MSRTCSILRPRGKLLGSLHERKIAAQPAVAVLKEDVPAALSRRMRMNGRSEKVRRVASFVAPDFCRGR